MKLFVETKLLHTLFDASYKVIVYGNTPVIESPATDNTSPLRVLRFMVTDQNVGVLWEHAVPQDSVTELKYPPVNCTALWATSEQEGVDLDKLRSWWSGRGAAEREPKLMLGDASQLHHFLLMQLLGEMRSMLSRNSDLMESLVVLREEHQQTRKTLIGFQETVENLRLAKRQMIATCEPVDQLGWEEGAKKQKVLRQKLPCSAKGLAAVDIFIAQESDAQGVFICSLVARESGVELGNWQMPFQALRAGWYQLALDAAIEENYSHLDLVIQSVSSAGLPPVLGASKAGVVETYFLRRNEDATEATLALRMWGGLPGSKSSAMPQLESKAGHVFEYALSAKQMHTARKNRDVQADFNYFQFIRESEILLHPVRGEIVSLTLPSVIPAGARKIIASVSVEDERCPSTVQFSLAASRHCADEGPVHEQPEIISSAWVDVKPGSMRYLVELQFDDGLTHSADLHLFTRVENGGSVDYARAMFHSISVCVDMAGAVAKPGIDLAMIRELAAA